MTDVVKVILVACLLLTIKTASAAVVDGDSVCHPHVGMSEEQFMKQFDSCACFRPSFNSNGEADLRPIPESQFSVRMAYVCMQKIDEYSTITVFHGRIESIAAENPYLTSKPRR